jgi:hypothetical protein
MLFWVRASVLGIMCLRGSLIHGKEQLCHKFLSSGWEVGDGGFMGALCNCYATYNT